MFSFVVSLSNDLSFLLTPPVAMHEHFGPPPPPPAPPVYVKVGVAVDFPAIPMFWPPGMAMGKNKLSTKVLHKGVPICLGSHDVGVMIPHVQTVPSPLNTLTALQILFSSRSSVFQSSTVLMEGKTVAACTMFNLEAPPSPLIACMDPVSLPIASAPTAHLNTVMFGMSLADYLIAVVTVAVTMAVEFALSRGGDPPSGWREVLSEKLLTSSFRGWAAKTAVGLASGGARLAFTDGPAALTVGVGSPYLQIQAQLQRDDKGQWTVSVGSQLGPAQSQIGHNVTTGATSSQISGGDPTGSSTIAASSDRSGTQTGTETHSLNPAHWGAPL